MTTIQIPDDQADALRAKASAEGLTLEQWLEKLAGTKVAPSRNTRRSPYTLDELLAQCDLSAPLSDEDAAWLNMPSVGREV